MGLTSGIFWCWNCGIEHLLTGMGGLLVMIRPQTSLLNPYNQPRALNPSVGKHNDESGKFYHIVCWCVCFNGRQARCPQAQSVIYYSGL